MKSNIHTHARWWKIDLCGLAICAAMTALGFYTLIRPSIDSRQAYMELHPQVTELSNQVQSERASLVALQESMESTKLELQGLSLRLESSSQVNKRLSSLAELASTIGLEVHQILPDTIRSGERYDIVPIALSGAGDYKKVTQFMQEVHDNFADIAVIEFDLSAKVSQGNSASFDIGLAWYTLPAMGMVEN